MGKVPGIAQCFRLMEEYEMLPNIMRHSIVVAQVAMELINGFAQSDSPPASIPNKSLVLAGALLHDIAKTPCLQNDCDHAAKGAEICHQLGFPEVASIVEEHVVLRDHGAERRRRGMFNAREIIYYADKRVRHEEIVNLDDRLEYIIEHYGNGDPYMHELIRINFEKCVELERHLFTFLPFSADKVADAVAGSQTQDFFRFVSD